MERKIITLALSFFAFSCAAQDGYIRKGVISASGTISPSAMLNNNESNYYLSGFLDIRFDDHWSFRGDTYWLLDSKNEIGLFDEALRSDLGIQYHLTNGNFDAHFGFMPGLLIAMPNAELRTDYVSRYHVSPSMTLQVGASYYIWKYMHFGVNLGYVNSKVYGFGQSVLRSDELIFSMGLGWNVQAFNRKK